MRPTTASLSGRGLALRKAQETWEEDKREAREFVAQQPAEGRAALAQTIEELVALAETSDAPRARVRELLNRLDNLVEAGAGRDVYALALVQEAGEYSFEGAGSLLLRRLRSKLRKRAR